MSANDEQSWQHYIGVVSTREQPLLPRDIKRFCQATDQPLPAPGQPAPPLITQLFAHDDAPLDALPADGGYPELNIDLPAQRLMGGSSQYEFFCPLYAGDTVTTKSWIADIYSKQGKQDYLYFIKLISEFYNQHQQLCARETGTFIKR